MKVVSQFDIEGPKLISIDVFKDSRGFFCELFNEPKIADLTGVSVWRQANLSRSTKGVLRGLHYQKGPKAQAKLVSVIKGRVLDVAVDIRANSPTYGQHLCVELSEEDPKLFFIPTGFAHGFFTMSEEVYFYYQCSELYEPGLESGIRWDDPTLKIDWPKGDLEISEKDRKLPAFLHL